MVTLSTATGCRNIYLDPCHSSVLRQIPEKREIYRCLYRLIMYGSTFDLRISCQCCAFHVFYPDLFYMAEIPSGFRIQNIIEKMALGNIDNIYSRECTISCPELSDLQIHEAIKPGPCI